MFHQDPTPYAGDGWLNLQKDGPQEQRGTEVFRVGVGDF